MTNTYAILSYFRCSDGNFLSIAAYAEFFRDKTAIIIILRAGIQIFCWKDAHFTFDLIGSIYTENDFVPSVPGFLAAKKYRTFVQADIEMNYSFCGIAAARHGNLSEYNGDLFLQRWRENGMGQDKNDSEE